MRHFTYVFAFAFVANSVLGATLSGRVTRIWSTDGIGDVDVTVAIPGGKALKTGTTDANGDYTIAGLPPGQRVLISYLRDDYQEKPTRHYLILFDGENHDSARMAPDNLKDAQYRVYGEKFYEAEAAGEASSDMSVIFAHFADDKRALIAEGYASRAAAGKTDNDRKQAAQKLLTSFLDAQASEYARSQFETADAFAAALQAYATVLKRTNTIVLTVPAHFKSGGVEIPKDAQKRYAAIARKLMDFDQFDVVIQGHADATGPASLNKELAERRATEVREYLIKEGIPKDKLKTKSADVIIPGKLQPGRRVDLVITIPGMASDSSNTQWP